MRRKKVLILHGLGGSDYPHWQTFVACELIKKNYIVSFPNLPKRDNPTLDEWLEALDKEFKHFKPDIVICHSLANVLWFHFVTRFQIEQIEKLMLVAPISTQPIQASESFYPYPIPKDLRAKESIMVSSTNDPYMSVDEAIELQSKLNIGLKILEDAGHINSDSGYGELHCAVDWVVQNSQEEQS